MLIKKIIILINTYRNYKKIILINMYRDNSIINIFHCDL